MKGHLSARSQHVKWQTFQLRVGPLHYHDQECILTGNPARPVTGFVREPERDRVLERQNIVAVLSNSTLDVFFEKKAIWIGSQNQARGLRREPGQYGIAPATQHGSPTVE